LRRASYDFIERLESLALLGDEELGIADNVNQQDMANLQLKLGLRISGHIVI
jgi:hypothetical protein